MFHHTLSVEASWEAGPDLGGSGRLILSVSRIGSLTGHLLQVAAHQWVPWALLPQFRSGFLTRVSLKSTAGQLEPSLGPAAQGPSRCAERPIEELALGPGVPDTSGHGQPKLRRFSSG